MQHRALLTHFRPAGPAAGCGALCLAVTALFGCTEEPSAAASRSAEERRNIQAVTSVLQDGVVGGDAGVIERMVREDYIQHSLQMQDGRAGLLASLSSNPSSRPSAATIHRMLADDDFVAVHVSYGTDDPATEADERTVAFDVFRLEDGLLAEHWDARAPAVPSSQAVSGRSMVDGAAEVTDWEDTEANRRVVSEFVDLVFTRGQFNLLDTYLADPYYQHDPLVPDGIAGLQSFVAQAAAMGISIGYTSAPLVVAEGNFVLVGAEGFLGPSADPPFAVLYDMWRLEGGKMIEHWDLIPPLPADMSTIPHDNGIFCPTSPCTLR